MNENYEAMSERIRTNNDLEAEKYLKQIEGLEISEEDKQKAKEVFDKYLKANQKEGTPITSFDSEDNTLIEDIVADLNRKDITSDIDTTGIDTAWSKVRPGEIGISPQNKAKLESKFRSKSAGA